MNRPDYSVKSPEQENSWWQWADGASDAQLLEALHGCASWSDIAAHVCLSRLEERGLHCLQQCHAQKCQH